jgi:hypothetical protein
LAINCFIWGHFDSSMIRGIIKPSCERNPLCTLVWFFGGKAFQIGFQSLVDHMSLTIYLRVICNVNFKLGTLEFKKFLPKFASEGMVLNQENGGGHVV